MKNELNNNHLALTVGLFSGLWHAIWALLVGIGIAKDVLDMIIPLHFLNIAYSLFDFSLSGAIVLVALAFIGGYIFGWIFAAIWNWTAKKVK